MLERMSTAQVSIAGSLISGAPSAQRDAAQERRQSQSYREMVREQFQLGPRRSPESVPDVSEDDTLPLRDRNGDRRQTPSYSTSEAEAPLSDESVDSEEQPEPQVILLFPPLAGNGPGYLLDRVV